MPVFVAEWIVARVDGGPRQEQVRELLNRYAPDAAADGADHVLASGVLRRIGSGGAGDRVEIDGAASAETAHRAGVAEHLTRPPHAQVIQVRDDGDDVTRVAARRDAHGDAGEGAPDFIEGGSLDEREFARRQRTA